MQEDIREQRRKRRAERNADRALRIDAPDLEPALEPRHQRSIGQVGSQKRQKQIVIDAVEKLVDVRVQHPAESVLAGDQDRLDCFFDRALPAVAVTAIEPFALQPGLDDLHHRPLQDAIINRRNFQMAKLARFLFRNFANAQFLWLIRICPHCGGKVHQPLFVVARPGFQRHLIHAAHALVLFHFVPCHAQIFQL
jgi:hypothetical protein